MSNGGGGDLVWYWDGGDGAAAPRSPLGELVQILPGARAKGPSEGALGG